MYPALLGVTLLAQACASVPPVTDRDLTVSEGTTFTVVLDDRAGTGYAWSVDGVEVETLALVDRLVQPTGTAPGAGERLTFVFLAKRSGTVTLNFTYARPWEDKTTPPSRSLRVQIIRC